MKRLLFTLSLFSFGFVYAAEDWQKFPVGPFSTLNNRDNSYAIGSNQAQDLLNVDLTPGGKSVRKRHGYGVAWTLSQTTSPVHGVYDFFDANGNEVNLFFNDTKITSSIGGAAASVIYSTGPFGATYQCTDSLGFAYCANTSRTTLFKTNGTSVSSINTVSSTGTMVATAVTRLVMAGFSDAPSRIDLSADTDFTTWGSGSLGTSPAQFTINSPGAKITHIVYAFNRLMWFKDTSFGYILIGNQPAQSDWVIKTVSYDVGTNDNSSIYREGILYFRGKDGHIYAFDGYNYQRMTKEISGTIAQAQTKAQGSWIQTSGSDFGTGFSSGTTLVDTTTVPGQVQLTGPEIMYFNATTGTITGSIFRSFDVRISSPPYYFSQQVISSNTFLLDSLDLVLSKTGTTTDTVVKFMTDSSTNTPGTVLSTGIILSSSLTASSATINITLTPTAVLSNGSTYWVQIVDSGPGFGLTIWGRAGNCNQYRQSTLVTGSCQNLDLVGKKYTTGTWQSAVKNAPFLTSWDAFNATYINVDGSNSFFIRSSTSSFSMNSSTPAWTAINNGAIPTVSTGTYFQIRDVIATNISTTTPVLYDFTQNWFEGSATDKMYATYFDDKLLFSLPIGTGATTNNRILLYDLLSQGWLIYDLASNGFYVKANKLYFGSAAGGYVYKYGDVESDNGASINSYWKSKDFFGGDPFTTQELANISIAAKEVDNSSMTVTYTLNGSSSTAYIMPLTSSKDFVGLNKNLPAGKVGSTFNIQFGNNAIDQPWEVFGIQIGIRPRSWNAGGP